MRSLSPVLLVACVTGRGLSDDVQSPDPTGPLLTSPGTEGSELRVREEEEEHCDGDGPGSLEAERDGEIVRVLHAVPDLGSADDWSAEAERDGDTIFLSYTAASEGSAPCTLVFDLAIEGVPSGEWTVAWRKDPAVSDLVTVP